ncbi:MBL fold metallo-hydrolase [Rubritalea marina]|uniref:MBL fold metallo-hydrolase n=1 Tax=Rubritalea marina TaxID=361055 RepID=UPI00036B9A20|nr:MBL fold metallo-hydrolase [Rubritalea marina]
MNLSLTNTRDTVLEDDFNDCLMKAMHGQALNTEKLAIRAGIPQERILRTLQGEHDTPTISALASILGLDSDKLVNLKSYQPRVTTPHALHMITSPFGHLGVNAYIVTSNGESIIFDTGTDSTELHRIAPNPKHLCITHNHPDHNQGMQEFESCTIFTPDSLNPGDSISIGSLGIEVIDSSGHFSPARTYLIHGDSSPIAIVGDAIFAGSIGKIPGNKYNSGLKTIRENILNLDPSTILCPGHGPLTTVAQELLHNPFF